MGKSKIFGPFGTASTFWLPGRVLAFLLRRVGPMQIRIGISRSETPSCVGSGRGYFSASSDDASECNWPMAYGASAVRIEGTQASFKIAASDIAVHLTRRIRSSKHILQPSW